MYRNNPVNQVLEEARRIHHNKKFASSLGYVITEDQVKMQKRKVRQQARQFPWITRGSQRFPRVSISYRRFIPG
jgi:hypothetical protein